MKVKSTRKFVTKTYTFIDDNDKEVPVEFKFYAFSTRQGESWAGEQDASRPEIIKSIFEENLVGPEPYKSALIQYMTEEGNMFEEIAELVEQLGKLKPDGQKG